MNDIKQQPEALRLAECLDDLTFTTRGQATDAAAELRRLHAANLNCMEWYEAVKSERDDLLLAMTKLVEDLEMRSNWKRGDEKGVVDCGNSVYLNARAAIAKAEGEKQ